MESLIKLLKTALVSRMAARVSTTREPVARVLGDLPRRKIVVREKDCLVVTDVDQLAEITEE